MTTKSRRLARSCFRRILLTVAGAAVIPTLVYPGICWSQAESAPSHISKRPRPLQPPTPIVDPQPPAKFPSVEKNGELLWGMDGDGRLLNGSLSKYAGGSVRPAIAGWYRMGNQLMYADSRGEITNHLEMSWIQVFGTSGQDMLVAGRETRQPDPDWRYYHGATCLWKRPAEKGLWLRSEFGELSHLSSSMSPGHVLVIPGWPGMDSMPSRPTIFLDARDGRTLAEYPWSLRCVAVSDSGGLVAGIPMDLQAPMAAVWRVDGSKLSEPTSNFWEPSSPWNTPAVAVGPEFASFFEATAGKPRAGLVTVFKPTGELLWRGDEPMQFGGFLSSPEGQFLLVRRYGYPREVPGGKGGPDEIRLYESVSGRLCWSRDGLYIGSRSSVDILPGAAAVLAGEPGRMTVFDHQGQSVWEGDTGDGQVRFCGDASFLKITEKQSCRVYRIQLHREPPKNQ